MKRPHLAAAPIAVLAALAAGCGGPSRVASVPVASPPLGGPVTAAPAAGHSYLARPGFSLVAVARNGQVGLHPGPGARRVLRTQRSPDPRFPLVMLVRQARPGWLQVYLPVRPNQSLAWIRAAEVRVRYDPYRVEVNLRGHRLLLWQGRRLLERQPIGVGTAATPTPPGVYYIIEEFRLSDPGGPFGPYALGLSAYSNVLKSFGTGPGQIALHGTDDPAGIGSNVSHGCIHLRNAAITRLAHLLPAGTPVQIRA